MSRVAQVRRVLLQPRPEEAESFSAGPFSRDNSKIVLTSRKGWYVATVADGTRARVHAG